MVDLNLLCSVGTVTQFKKNEIVFLQDDIGDSMYIALKGKFGVYINSFSDFPMRVADIENGSFFGEMSVIGGWPRSATIIAEDEGAALLIGKNDFEPLLRKSPELAEIMFNTLKSRAIAAIEQVRKSGKTVPDLSPIFKSAPTGDIKRIRSSMTSIAKRIRDLNEMLGSTYVQPPKQAEASPEEIIKLLPDGYEPFNLNEQNNNSSMLQLKVTICPYCLNASSSYIPLFPNLVQKQHTLDQRIIYHDFDILWYTNIVCPNCNYTDTYQEFTKLKYHTNSTKLSGNRFVNVEGFTGFASTHNHTLDEVIMSYYLNIACLKKTVNDSLRFAKAWIRLYWLYSDNDCRELAKQSAAEARGYYLKYIRDNKMSVGAEDKMRFNAILAELSIALDELSKAREYLKENVTIGRVFSNALYEQSLKRYGDIKIST